MRTSFCTHVRGAMLATALAAASAHAQGPVPSGTTIILVRHAEKAAAPASDPALTPTGALRAEALARLVADAGVRAIVSTQFLRTRLTAEPAAAALGLAVEVLDARLSPRATADSLIARHRGQAVLVVGHSNTVPGIVEALGAWRPPDICDTGYDNVYVVTVPATGAATVVRLHYGEKAGCP